MKQLFFILLATCSVLQFHGQGTVKVSSGTTVKTTGGAYLVLENMHLVNDGSLEQTAGNGYVKFSGNMDVNLAGSGTTTINTLVLSKAMNAILNLQTNIDVVSAIDFQGGLFNLSDKYIDLGTTGQLTGESESSRAFTTGSGYIQANATINSTSSYNAGNLGAIISQSTTPGFTTIRRGHFAQQVAVGSTSIQRYYDIIPTINNSLNATLRFTYFDAELNGLAEPALVLWRSAGSSWNNLGANTKDVTSNYVEKTNVQNFARMTLASGCPDITVTIADAYAVSPGGDANTVYIGYAPSLTLKATVSGATPPYTYKWTQNSPTGTILGTKANLNVSPATTTTYYLSVIDDNGCSAAVVSKTINVVDVRCGDKLNQVTVCVLQKGSYSTQCVSAGKVKGYLTSGGYLGACKPAVQTYTRSNPVPGNDHPFTVNVMPNPATNYFTVVVNSSSDEPVNIRVIDGAGRIVETLQKVKPNKSMRLGDKYIPGLYYVEVTQGTHRAVVKVIRQSGR